MVSRRRFAPPHHKEIKVFQRKGDLILRSLPKARVSKDDRNGTANSFFNPTKAPLIRNPQASIPG